MVHHWECERKSAWIYFEWRKNAILCVWFVDFSCCVEFSRRTRVLSNREVQESRQQLFLANKINFDKAHPNWQSKLLWGLSRACFPKWWCFDEFQRHKKTYCEWKMSLLSDWRLTIRTNLTSFYFPIKNQLTRALKSIEMCFIAAKTFFHSPHPNLLILVKLNFNIPLLNQTYFFMLRTGDFWIWFFSHCFFFRVLL